MGDHQPTPGIPDQRLSLGARQIGHDTASSGQAPRRASSTSIVVRRTREEGRQTTAFPATRAEEATSVGTQTGELAACQPSTTP